MTEHITAYRGAPTAAFLVTAVIIEAGMRHSKASGRLRCEVRELDQEWVKGLLEVALLAPPFQPAAKPSAIGAW